MFIKPRSTSVKLLLCGRIAIVKSYENKLWYNTQYSRIKKVSGEKIEKTEEEKLNIRKRSSYRSRNNVYNLISTNAWFWKRENNTAFLPTFLTLTFKENITDIKDGNYLHSKFIKRLNYYIYHTKRTQLKYLSVIEFQKKGRIHYHIIFFNLPFIDKKELADVWDQGFILIKAVDPNQNVAGYLTKYMTKNNKETKLDKKKRYFCSRKLLRPEEINREEKVLEIIGMIPKTYIKKIGSFKSDYHGMISITEYDFGQGKSIKDVIELPNY